MVLLQPKLPEGATVSGAWLSDGERKFVHYRGRRYEIIPRPNGNGACFDFSPPISMSEPKKSSELAPTKWEDRLSTLLEAYWYIPVILAAILFSWRFGLRQKRNDFSLYENMPGLVAELEVLLKSQGETELASQISKLRIIDRCRCGDEFCATFYVQPKPRGAYGPGHRNVALSPETGMLILDVVGDKIAAIEALYRDEIRRKLLELVP